MTGKIISGKDYEHALKVWNVFEMKMMKDYHDLYFKCDGLLLSDVFETFRNYCLKNYGLCLSHYLSWEAILNITKFDFEPIVLKAYMYFVF